MDEWDAKYQAAVGVPKYAGKENYSRRANADETAVVMKGPDHQWVPGDSERATGPGIFSKARITLMITALATGYLLPAFLIVGCFAVGTDLTGTRVLKDLMHQLPRPAEWVLRVWTSTIPIKNKRGGGYTNVTYKRPYLVNIVTGVVITVQRKAWMDTGAAPPRARYSFSTTNIVQQYFSKNFIAAPPPPTFSGHVHVHRAGALPPHEEGGWPVHGLGQLWAALRPCRAGALRAAGN